MPEILSDKLKQDHPNNPLHGVTLQKVLEFLVEKHGWEWLAVRMKINCFKNNPTIKSSLNFLRKTPWARKKVEYYYIRENR